MHIDVRVMNSFPNVVLIFECGATFDSHEFVYSDTLHSLAQQSQKQVTRTKATQRQSEAGVRSERQNSQSAQQTDQRQMRPATLFAKVLSSPQP